jgi:hypothetical protein
MRRSKLSMYFTYGTLLAQNKIVLSGHLHIWKPDDPKAKKTRLVLWDNEKWKHLADMPEIVSSLISVEENNRMAYYALLRTGVLHKWVENEHSVEVIDESASTFFFELRKIGTHLYACGMRHRVFRRGTQKWVPIDSEIIEKDVYKSFFSIDGHSEDDIYAVGMGGVIFHYNGQKWQKLESPTNLALNQVRCIKGETYIIGYGGLFFRGDVEGWELLARDSDKYDLTDIVHFDGRFYVASGSRLMTYNESEESLDPVKIPIKGELAFGALCCGFGQLWSIGDETILRFDGQEWTRFDFSYNKPLPEKMNKPGSK